MHPENCLVEWKPLFDKPRFAGSEHPTVLIFFGAILLMLIGEDSSKVRPSNEQNLAKLNYIGSQEVSVGNIILNYSHISGLSL